MRAVQGTQAGMSLGGTKADSPVRQPRTRRCDVREVVLGGAWGGVGINVGAKTVAIGELLEPIGHRNSAGNANRTRTRGTWDLT